MADSKSIGDPHGLYRAISMCPTAILNERAKIMNAILTMARKANPSVLRKGPLTYALLVAVFLSGCATLTPEQKALIGGAIGAAAGAIGGAALDDDHRGRGAAIGAVAGAVTGAALGYAIGVTQERQLRTRQEVENEVHQQGTALPVQPVVQIDSLTADPSSAFPGNTVQVIGVYAAYGPRDDPPQGTIQLSKDAEVLVTSPLELSNTGRCEFAKTITLPKDAQTGEYTVTVTMNHGLSRVQKQVNFSVV